MFKFNYAKNRLLIVSIFLLSTISLKVHAVTATFDPATGIVDFPVVELLNGASSSFFNAQLQLIGNTSNWSTQCF